MRVWGLGFRVWGWGLGFGLRVWALGFRVWGLGLRFQGLECRVSFWGGGGGALATLIREPKTQQWQKSTTQLFFMVNG